MFQTIFHFINSSDPYREFYKEKKIAKGSGKAVVVMIQIRFFLIILAVMICAALVNVHLYADDRDFGKKSYLIAGGDFNYPPKND